MALTKPPVLPAWAESGDKVQPSDSEIQTGWPLSNVPPSRQRFNWLLNFLANGVRYLTRRGVPDWANDETYEIGDYVRGPDNKTYRAKTQNTNKTPASNAGDWERWGYTYTELVAAITGAIDLSGYAPKADPAFTGNPTAPTAAQFDNDTSLATTAHVQRALGNLRGVTSVNAATVFSVSHVGKLVQFYGNAAAQTHTMPDTSTTVDGVVMLLSNFSSYIQTVQRAGASDQFQLNSVISTSLTLWPGEWLLVCSATASARWEVIGGSAGDFYLGTRRRKLYANLTMYVSTTGNDGNDGLTSGTAVATLNKAYTILQSQYDLSGYAATIQLADGTYTAGLSTSLPIAGQSGPVIINGNAATPSNVVINVASGFCISSSGPGVNLLAQNLKVVGNYGLNAVNGGLMYAGAGLVYGALSAGQITASNLGTVVVQNSYTINGASPSHWYAANNGAINVAPGITVTITGTPTYSNCFAIAGSLSNIACAGITFSGSATGARYNSYGNSVINTSSAGASYLPGSLAGSTATGGQYI